METTTSFAQMVIDRIKNECNTVDVEERFASSIDDVYEHELFFQNMHLTPSRVLKECDPIAYSQGINDYADTDEDLIEIDGEYYTREDVESVKADILSEIENSIG